MTNIERVREQIKQMTEDERLELIRLCNLENNKTNEQNIYLKLSNNHHCPHCNSNKICKNGHAGKYQQFRCNACKKNYTIRTGTIFQGTHKSIEVWQEYIELFSQGKSLPYISKTMKINIKTAFFWRHKILKVLTQKDDNDKLGGIVEADETFFKKNRLTN
jgi:transposase-like protein